MWKRAYQLKTDAKPVAKEKYYEARKAQLVYIVQNCKYETQISIRRRIIDHRKTKAPLLIESIDPSIHPLSYFHLRHKTEILLMDRILDELSTTTIRIRNRRASQAVVSFQLRLRMLPLNIYYDLRTHTVKCTADGVVLPENAADSIREYLLDKFGDSNLRQTLTILYISKEE
jgi:hypothetical protein